MPTKSAEQSEHPIRRRFTPPSRRLLLAALGLVGLAVIGTALYLNSRVTVPYFSWAKAQGWDVQPVRVVRLEPKWLMRFERVPDDPSPQELAVFRTSWNTRWSGNVRYYVKDKPTAALRQAYERFLAQHPHFFYTEYEIADWYRENNDAGHYHAWLEQSLRDAPAVLAGRVVYDNGAPAANVTCSVRITVQCKKGLDNHTMIGWYLTATTDGEGCYYLPVFRGIYSTINHSGLNQMSATDAQGREMNLYQPEPAFSGVAYQNASHESLVAGAVTISRVGVLPKMIARPNIQILSPTVPVGNDEKHPAIVSGNVLDLKWTPVPGAVRYTMELDYGGDENDTIMQPNDPHFQGGSALTELKLPLDGTDNEFGASPVFNRNQVYRIVIFADGSSNTGNLDDLIDISDIFYFSPSGAAAPEAITKQNFLRALGPGGAVTSFVTKGNQVTIQGTVQLGTINPTTMSTKFEPLFGQPDDEGAGGDFTLGMVDSQGEQTYSVTFTKPSP